MRILALASGIPATSSMPGSPRLFCLTRELSRHHEMHLATLCGSEHRYDLFLKETSTNPVFKSVTILPNRPPTTWWNRQVNRINLGAGASTRYACPEYHRQIRTIVQDLLRRERIGLVYVDGLLMTQYVEATAERPAIADIHDSGSLLFRRMMRVEKDLRRKALLYLESLSESRWERTLGRLFSLIVTNSAVDEGVIKKLSPSANTLTIVNGVDSEFFTPNHGASDPAKLVFTGVMSYGPNEDAATYFCDAILPFVRRLHPEAEFWVVGDQPTPRVRSLAGQPGVHVTGGVADVRPYLDAAGVFVCPLRYGSGVKNKILAALCMAKPVVATRLSLEGLDLRENRDVLVADEPADFAEKVIGLVRDPARAEALGRSGQGFVRARYSWSARAAQLDEALRTLPHSPRASNCRDVTLTG
jgi:glycosyltransferase involved in cell wall biosynthesis